MPSTTNIRTGAPQPVGGYAFKAPLGTTPPTNAVTALNVAYLDQGYVDADGVTINPQVTTEDKKDWNLDTIASVTTDRGATATVTFTESGINTLETIYGADNVSITGVGSDVVSVSFDGEPLPHAMWAFELKGAVGKVGRVVINNGQVVTPGGGERVYKPSELKSFQVTIKCYKDASGMYFHEYEDAAV